MYCTCVPIPSRAPHHHPAAPASSRGARGHWCIRITPFACAHVRLKNDGRWGSRSTRPACFFFAQCADGQALCAECARAGTAASSPAVRAKVSPVVVDMTRDEEEIKSLITKALQKAPPMFAGAPPARCSSLLHMPPPYPSADCCSHCSCAPLCLPGAHEIRNASHGLRTRSDKVRV